jgi:Tfp pilus assembly protein PilF
MRWIQLALALALCACVTVEKPLSTDKVRDAETAIVLGKKICSQRGGDVDGQWVARFRLGVWDVEQIDPDDHSKWYKRLRIWADNGKANECEEMVVVT